MEEVGCSFYSTYRYFIKLISNALLSSLKINLALPIITKYLYCYLMSFVKFWGRFAWTIFRSIDQNNGFIENTNSGNHWSDNKVFNAWKNWLFLLQVLCNPMIDKDGNIRSSIYAYHMYTHCIWTMKKRFGEINKILVHMCVHVGVY